MGVEEILNFASDNGMSIIIMLYFLYKDYKFNESILQVLGEVKEVLASLQAWHMAETK